MTREEAEFLALETSRRLWGVECPLALWRHRRWILVGAVWWEASAARESDASECDTSDPGRIQILMDDKSGEILQARRYPPGWLTPKTRKEVTSGLCSAAVVGAVLAPILALWDALPPWGFWMLMAVAAVAAGCWLRVRIFRRRVPPAGASSQPRLQREAMSGPLPTTRPTRSS